MKSPKIKLDNEKEIAEGIRLVAAFREVKDAREREKIIAIVEDAARRSASHKDP